MDQSTRTDPVVSRGSGATSDLDRNALRESDAAGRRGVGSPPGACNFPMEKIPTASSSRVVTPTSFNGSWKEELQKLPVTDLLRIIHNFNRLDDGINPAYPKSSRRRGSPVQLIRSYSYSLSRSFFPRVSVRLNTFEDRDETCSALVLFEILRRYVILRNLPGADPGFLRLGSLLNPIDCTRFERLALVDEFFDALRVRFRSIW
jgi:hypothetical protein